MPTRSCAHGRPLRISAASPPPPPPRRSPLLQVRSRGFTVLGDPHMIPGADMFNHDPDKQSVQIGTDGEDFFVMKTVSALAKYRKLSRSLLVESCNEPPDPPGQGRRNTKRLVGNPTRQLL